MPVLLPDVQKQNDETSISVSFEGVVSIGSLRLLSTSTCFAPNKSFSDGKRTIVVSPWGGPIFALIFAVDVPEPPTVVADTILKKSISVIRPLEIGLSAHDSVYTYTLAAGDRSADCPVKEDQSLLICDIESLSLNHAQEYSFRLSRSIPSATEPETVSSFDATTLAPVAVLSTSVAQAQIVYDEPKSIQFIVDKTLNSAEVSLVRKDGDNSVHVATKVVVDGAQGNIELLEPLARKSEYTLTIQQLEGSDGSALAGPHVVPFSTSGGPKVAEVSVGANSLSRNERIVIRFDQAIDASVDVAAFIRIAGAGASIARASDTEVALTLQGAPLCSALTVTVDKNIKSGSNGSLSDEEWRFNTRVMCGESSVIGRAVRGRPIVAYYFGSGASTILFTGGIHGSEPSSYSTMQAWVNYLQANGNVVPANKRVVIVPNTNPDGIAAGSRYSSNNVNLARNFPTANWKADIETASGTIQNGGGTRPASEPETAALIVLTRQLRPRLEVSFHAQGSLVGANKFSDSVTIGDIYASTVGYNTMYYNAEAVMGYPMTGEYEDWMGEEMGIPALLIELPSLSGNYFNSQLPSLIKMLSV